MRIIGEKINGTLKKTAAAIAERDAAFIRDLAIRQVAAGADYLDVNAGTKPKLEPPVIALLLDDAGIPSDVDRRLKIGRYILEHTRPQPHQPGISGAAPCGRAGCGHH